MARLNSIAALVLLCLALTAQSQDIFPGPIMRTIAAAGGGGAITAETAVFDGSNDFIRNLNAVNGLADGKTVTLSFWVRFTGGDGAVQRVFTISQSTSTDRFYAIRMNTNKLRVFAEISGTGTILHATSLTTITVASGWVHVYVAIDLANSSNRHMYFNGVEDGSVSWTTYSDFAMDLAATTPRMTIGASGANGDLMQADLAELWFDDTYLNDVTKFYSAGHPISLGANGQTPTGSAPVVYLSLNGSGNSWATDSSGNGNTLTVTGALGTTTSP